MTRTMQTEIADFRRGGFRRFRLTVAGDSGHATSEFVGGFDTLDEALAAAAQIEDESDRLVREGWILSTDEKASPFFWITDRQSGTGATVFEDTIVGDRDRARLRAAGLL